MAEPTKPNNQTITTPNQSKKSLPPHYVLTIEGTALISGRQTEYEVEVKVPDLGEGKGDGHYMTFAISEDRGDLLTKAIRKKYKDCETIRTHYLVDRQFVSSDGKAAPRARVANDRGEALTVSTMRKGELLDYVKEMKFNIDTTLYNKVDTLREAIMLYQNDREAFLAKQEKDKEEARIKEEASLLNE